RGGGRADVLSSAQAPPAGAAMTETLTDHRSLPLSDLSPEERDFQQLVREFADERVRPLVARMDEEERIPRELIDACFGLGIMGIEIPERYQGVGSTFFTSILVVEQL